MTDLSSLPERAGAAPKTNPNMPHEQLTDNAPKEFQEALFDRLRQLPGVKVGASHVSVPGARAFHLDKALAGGGDGAFMRGTEFAHLHPDYDGSLHLVLPEDQARLIIDKGWAEFHPLVAMGVMPPTLVMVFGPRNPEELDVVARIVESSYEAAIGSAPSN